MKYMFDEELILFGLKRSGNAAIISFILHLGDKREFTHDHNTHLRVTKKFAKWQRKNLYYYRKHLNTVENMNLQEMLKESDEYNRMKKELALKLGCDSFSGTQRNLILLRSPHNNLASLFASRLRGRIDKINDFQYLWKQYADEVLSITNYLGDSKIVILFDEWFQSENYRKYLSSLLGVEYTDRTDVGINRVIRLGSSFDGKKYQGKAQQMKVLDRWKKYKDNSEYREILLGDEDIVERTKEIFDIDLSLLLEL